MNCKSYTCNKSHNGESIETQKCYGSIGPTGKTGKSGHMGPQGPQGPQGLPGPPGPACTCSNTKIQATLESIITTLNKINDRLDKLEQSRFDDSIHITI